MSRPLLTARWTNVCLFSYAAPRELLEPHLPRGLELDTLEGRALVSLVAFQFLDTRLLGVPWPGYRSFPELNLRFYVRHGRERGVVFIREIIPLRFPAWAARVLYHEPYRVAPLVVQVHERPDSRSVEYRLGWADRTHRLVITGDEPAFLPAENTLEHFFKEQRWGFGRDRRGRCTRFEVEHPTWKVHRVRSWQLDFDWGEVYGPEWKLLTGREPLAVVLAAGSEVQVFRSRRFG